MGYHILTIYVTDEHGNMLYRNSNRFNDDHIMDLLNAMIPEQVQYEGGTQLGNRLLTDSTSISTNATPHIIHELSEMFDRPLGVYIAGILEDALPKARANKQAFINLSMDEKYANNTFVS